MLKASMLISLQITAIYVAMWDGNILGWLRAFIATGLDQLLSVRISRYIQKPIWDCLPCMASVWTILLACRIDLLLILTVCGINVIIDQFIKHPDNERPVDS